MLSVYGQYACSEAVADEGVCQDEEEAGPQVIKLTYGHLKDHRPDLKQAALSWVINGPANLPIWMEGQDGNSSDKSSFHEAIERVQAFKAQIAAGHPCKWVAGSA